MTAVSFSPDGRRVVTGSTDKTARIWDAITGDELVTLQGPPTPVRAAMFSPDGQRVVTIPPDGTVRVWDSTKGVQLRALKGHKLLVMSAAFSPDGQRLLTVSLDLTVRVWSVATGDELAVLKGHSKPINSAAFSSNGQRIVTASWDRTAANLGCRDRKRNRHLHRPYRGGLVGGVQSRRSTCANSVCGQDGANMGRGSGAAVVRSNHGKRTRDPQGAHTTVEIGRVQPRWTTDIYRGDGQLGASVECDR